MEHRTILFVGGPIDGQTRTVEVGHTIYKHEQPPVGSDIKIGEVPVGFSPPIHEYLYEESFDGSGTFVYIDQKH